MEQYRKKKTLKVFCQVTEQNYLEAQAICSQLGRYDKGDYDIIIKNDFGGGPIGKWGAYLVKDEFDDWNLYSDAFLVDYEPVSAPSVSEIDPDVVEEIWADHAQFIPDDNTSRLYLGRDWMKKSKFKKAVAKLLSLYSSSSESEEGQIAGVQWVKGAPKERKIHHGRVEGYGTEQVYEVILTPMEDVPNLWMASGRRVSFPVEGEKIIEHLVEYSSLSIAKEPEDRDEIRALAYRTFVSTINRLKKADFSDDDKVLLLDRLEKAFDWLEKTPSPSPGTGPRIVQSEVAKEQETAIAFVKWIAKNGQEYTLNTVFIQGQERYFPEAYDLFIQSQTK